MSRAPLFPGFGWQRLSHKVSLWSIETKICTISCSLTMLTMRRTGAGYRQSRRHRQGVVDCFSPLQADQSLLNDYFKGRWHRLPHYYNMMKRCSSLRLAQQALTLSNEGASSTDRICGKQKRLKSSITLVTAIKPGWFHVYTLISFFWRRKTLANSWGEKYERLWGQFCIWATFCAVVEGLPRTVPISRTQLFKCMPVPFGLRLLLLFLFLLLLLFGLSK